MANQKKRLGIPVVRCGNMDTSHASAYHAMDGFEICGIVPKGSREQRYFLKAIREIDVTHHMEDAVNSLRIAFACDESAASGKVTFLK